MLRVLEVGLVPPTLDRQPHSERDDIRFCKALESCIKLEALSVCVHYICEDSFSILAWQKGIRRRACARAVCGHNNAAAGTNTEMFLGVL